MTRLVVESLCEEAHCPFIIDTLDSSGPQMTGFRSEQVKATGKKEKKKKKRGRQIDSS